MQGENLEMPKLMDYDAYLKTDKNARVSQNGKVLSESDEKYNRTLYDKYIKQATLEGQKQVALTQNEDARKNALREQAVLSEKAKKYLGQQLALSGQAKTGAAESSILDLYARQANARNEINQSYKGKESDIMLEYDRQLNQVDADTNTRLMDIEADAEAQKKADRTESASALTQNLDDYKNNQMSFDDLINTYDKNKENLDSNKDSTLIKQFENEIVKHNKKKEFLGTYNFEPSKIISVEDAVSSTDSAIDSFGGWNSEASNTIIGMAKSGALDDLLRKEGVVDENNDILPVMFDVDGDSGTQLYYVYHNGYFYEVPEDKEELMYHKMRGRIYDANAYGIGKINNEENQNEGELF